MTTDQEEVLVAARKRCLAAYSLVASSVSRTGKFDPETEYSPEEREPFDALSDRFVRSVEVCLRFVRAYELFVQAVPSETIRDTLHIAEKLELITDAERWMDMRDVRNRIVHDYSPEQLNRIYADIRGSFFDELTHFERSLQRLTFEP